MRVVLKSVIIFSAIFLYTSAEGLHSQVLKDSSGVRLIRKEIDYIYNCQFKDALEINNRILKLYPDHPAGQLLKGLSVYWENYPLLPSSKERYIFEENLRDCIELCEKNPPSSDKAEYLIVNLCARGLLLLFFSDNDLNLEVFPLATSTYKYIRSSFDYTSGFADFLYFTGLYNYSREAFPEVYPVYKPLAILFPKGDKISGIKDLQRAAGSSIFLRAESFSFLSGIFIRFENNYQLATFYNKSLHELYPANLKFKEEYIKNLLLIKQYDEAEKLIQDSQPINSAFYKAQLTIFNGMLQEKKYRDNKKAQELYMKGIKEINPFGRYGDEFAAYAYFGLSRISGANGDKNYMKIYRKTANNLADLKNVTFD